MTVGYDEWALARTPSLLAFAHALADDPRTVDAAVTKALGRMRSRWHRVGHDDPDLEARHHVVRACATPRRAAVVLRVLEERSDAEIAEVLRCSESAVRRHLVRGLAEVRRESRAADPSGGSADDPADGARRQLATRVGSAPTQLLTRQEPTPDRPPRRRRGPGIAALAMAVLVGGVALIAHQSRTPDGVISYPKVHAPDTWRYESYDGVQLQVPDSWGWGSAPIRSTYFSGKDHLGACGSDQAAVLATDDESSYVTSTTSFVGRPVETTARCVTYGAAGTMPEAPAVWFGSPLAVGVKNVGPTLAETRLVGTQHVTVFSGDPAFRRKVLGTAHAVDVDANGCPTRAVTVPTSGPAGLKPDSMSVCVYSQDTGTAVLLYSTTRTLGSAQQYAALVDVARQGRDRCGTPSGRWVALGLHDGDSTRWDVANPACAEIQRGGGRSVAMTGDTVRNWAVDGVTAYVSPPKGDRALADYFQAPDG
jgi:hypothetical protein